MGGFYYEANLPQMRKNMYNSDIFTQQKIKHYVTIERLNAGNVNKSYYALNMAPFRFIIATSKTVRVKIRRYLKVFDKYLQYYTLQRKIRTA